MLLPNIHSYNKFINEQSNQKNGQFSNKMKKYISRLVSSPTLKDWLCELMNAKEESIKDDKETSFHSVLYSIVKKLPKYGFCSMYINGKMDYVFALEVDDPNTNPEDIENDTLIHMFECKNKEQKPEEKIVFKTDYIYKKTITFDEFNDTLKNSANETEFFKTIKKLLTH